MPAVIYIEPQTNYSGIARFLAKKSKARVFIPSVTHEHLLRSACANIGLDLEGRIIPHQGIDTDIDGMLYRSAMRLSTLTVNLIERVSNAFLDDPEFYLEKSVRHAFLIALHDRLVGHIRPPFALRQAMRGLRVTEVMLIEKDNGAASYLYDFLTISGFKKISVIRAKNGSFETGVGMRPRSKDAAKLVKLPPVLNYEEIFSETVTRNIDTILFINTKDRQYRLAAFPIIQTLIESGFNPLVLCAFPFDAEYLADFPILKSLSFFERNPRTKLLDVTRIHDKNIPFIRTVLARVHTQIKIDEDDEIASLADFMDVYLRAHLLPLLIYIREGCRALQPIVAKARGVAVLPGRYLESNMIVGIAREAGVPTVEIQSGTISATPRFVPPPSGHVLAIDPFSSQVYTNFMGLPDDRVTIVGSPKMDYDLRPHRRLTKAEARETLAHHGTFGTSIILLAAQPVGVARMAAVVRIVAAAVSQLPDTTLLIKQHPNENEHYTRMYEEITSKAGVESVVISKNVDIVSAIVGSDCVATFYSTVGLEAFSLGRPVISVNPFGDRPPYDLQMLGIAREARNKSEFLAHFHAAALSSHDPKLEMLRDGQAIARTTEFLCSHFLPVSAWRPLEDFRDRTTLRIRTALRAPRARLRQSLLQIAEQLDE